MMKNLLLAVFVVALMFAYVPSADAGKYPPEIKALVKLKKAVTFPDGRAMSRYRHRRVHRNLNNAYRKNKLGCTGITDLIDLVGYHSENNHHGLAMMYAQRAINLAYRCRDARYSRATNR